MSYLSNLGSSTERWCDILGIWAENWRGSRNRGQQKTVRNSPKRSALTLVCRLICCIIINTDFDARISYSFDVSFSIASTRIISFVLREIIWKMSRIKNDSLYADLQSLFGLRRDRIEAGDLLNFKLFWNSSPLVRTKYLVHFSK